MDGSCCEEGGKKEKKTIFFHVFARFYFLGPEIRRQIHFPETTYTCFVFGCFCLEGGEGEKRKERWLYTEETEEEN